MERTMSTEHTQIELFPFLTGRAHSRIARPRYLLKDLTLSVENTIVLCIVFVMAVVLFFSFGVERGEADRQGRLGGASRGHNGTIDPRRTIRQSC